MCKDLLRAAYDFIPYNGNQDQAENEKLRARIRAALAAEPDDAATVAAMLELCERRQGEFWQRLAGSIRKARGLI